MIQPYHFVAHRGYTAHFPENTLTAFTAAIKAGATHIELDIQFSKDGIPMVYHDIDLQRVSGRAGKIIDYTAAELETFFAFEPERLGDTFKDVPISTAAELAQLIAIKPEVHFYIELKEEALQYFPLEHCLRSLRDTFNTVIAQCTLISFDLPAMKAAKSRFGFPHTGIVLRNWENRNALISEHLADIAYINIKRIPAEDEICAACPVITYEIADPALAAATLKRGAAKIETFAVGELIEALCKPITT
jgi:glycerophosphoryl diester phosphodiesterase